MSSKLQDLIAERDSAYARYSDEIMEEISKTVLPAVLEVLGFSDQELEKLVWNNIHVFDEHLVLTGMVMYKEGDIVGDGKVQVTLDPAMVQMLNKVVRVAIPLQIAITGTKTEIADHLREAQKRLRAEYEATYPTDEPHGQNLDSVDLLHGMDFGPDFNYNQLTEEQQKSLMLHMTTQSKRKKLN